MSKDGKILYATHGVVDYSFGEDDSRYQYDGEKIVLTIPEGIEEIRSMADFGHCGKIIFPKSLKKLHIDPLRYCDNAEFVFQGDIPEIAGNTEPYLRLFLYLDSEATIKVKKGKKKELLRELMKGEEYNQKQKKMIASHITTF